jgi:hypothetical protein
MLLRSLYSQVEDLQPIRSKRHAAVRATESLRILDDSNDGGGKLCSDNISETYPNCNLEQKFEAEAKPAAAVAKKQPHKKQMLRAKKRMLDEEAQAKRQASATKKRSDQTEKAEVLEEFEVESDYDAEAEQEHVEVAPKPHAAKKGRGGKKVGGAKPKTAPNKTHWKFLEHPFEKEKVSTRIYCCNTSSCKGEA